MVGEPANLSAFLAGDLPTVLRGFCDPSEGARLLERYRWDPCTLRTARALGLQKAYYYYWCCRRANVPHGDDPMVAQMLGALRRLTGEEFYFLCAFPQFGYSGSEHPVHRDGESYFGRDKASMVTAFLLLYLSEDKDGGELQFYEAEPAKGKESTWSDMAYRKADNWTLTPNYDSKLSVGDCLLFPSSLYHNTRPFHRGQRMALKFVFVKKSGDLGKYPPPPPMPPPVLQCVQSIVPTPYPQWQDAKDKYDYQSYKSEWLTLSESAAKHGIIATAITVVINLLMSAMYFVFFVFPTLGYFIVLCCQPILYPKPGKSKKQE